MKKRKKRSMEAFSAEEKESGFVPVAPDLPPIQPTPDQFQDLFRKYAEYKELNLQPDFQRDFIWPVKKQKELIKSVWQGIPIPMFYFSQTKDNQLEVIDGQQRLTTLFGFYDKKSLPSNIRSRIFKNLNLKNAKGNKISDDEIRKKMKRELLLHCVLLDEDKINHSQKYEIFRRLNQGSMVLKPQEIRNCILQSAMPYFNSKVRALARFFETRFRKEFKFARMFGEEMVLRYFVIRKYGYEKKVSDYINFSIEKKLDSIKNDFSNKEEVNRYACDFKRLINRVYLLFADDSFQVLKKDEDQPIKNSKWNAHIFSSVFNQGVFHLFSFYLHRYDEHQFHRANIGKSRDCFLQLLKNKKFINLITGSATDQTWKIKASKELFEQEFLSKCLGYWTKKEDKNISRQAKKTLFKNIPYCYLCYGQLSNIEDADHINPYSKGFKSKFSNILLAHSKCNREKLDKTVAEYRDSNKKLVKRIQKNKKHIKIYIKSLKAWNKINTLKDFKNLIKYAKIDFAKVK